MPKHFEKPKITVISRAIIRDCRITHQSANMVKTNKTGRHLVRLTSKQIGELTDPLDQRILRMIDVRIEHIQKGTKDEWILSMLRHSPDTVDDRV